MQPVERVRTALGGGRPDRPPAAWWGHTFLEEWSPRELAAVTVRRARRFRWDFVKLQPRATCFAEAFGSEYRPSGSAREAPVLVRPAAPAIEDLARLPEADAGTPSLADQVEALRLAVSQVGPGVPVLQTVFSPLTVAGYLTGGDKRAMARALEERPEDVLPALERIAATLVDFAARSVEAGAAGIFYAVSGYASADLLPAGTYEALALPSDRAVLGSLPEGAWMNVLHLCGRCIHFDLSAALPAAAVSWSVHDEGNPSLREGRARSGRAVMGGVAQTTTLVHGTPDRVAAEVRAAMEDVEGESLLLAPGCSVPPEAPEENLRAMMQAVA